jgi:hypothetical protein
MDQIRSQSRMQKPVRGPTAYEQFVAQSAETLGVSCAKTEPVEASRPYRAGEDSVLRAGPRFSN